MNKIFAALSPFVVSNSNGDSTGDHLGVKIACLELQENIIRHGGCDCYHFLLGRGALSDEDIAACMSARGWDPQKILIFDGALPLDRIRKTHYHVIHKMDPFLDEVLALRHALGHPLAPATVTTHTMSYAFLMTLWLQCLLGHALPCDAIVCTSVAVQEMLQRTFDLLSDRFSTRFGARIPAFRGSLPIIPLGVNVEYWKPENNKSEAKRTMELPDQSCVILCPARFSAHDKMDLRPFLMTLRRLLAVVGPDFFRVVLVGDDLRTNGAESKLIQELANKWGLAQVVRIDTNGMPSRVRQYYAAADIMVSLIDNLQETFGLTVIQAMACGLPVVVSDWDGYKDTVVEGETGFRIRTYWAECDHQISSLHRHWMVEHLLLAQSVAVDTEQMLRDLYTLVSIPNSDAVSGKRVASVRKTCTPGRLS